MELNLHLSCNFLAIFRTKCICISLFYFIFVIVKTSLSNKGSFALCVCMFAMYSEIYRTDNLGEDSQKQAQIFFLHTINRHINKKFIKKTIVFSKKQQTQVRIPTIWFSSGKDGKAKSWGFLSPFFLTSIGQTVRDTQKWKTYS